MLGCRGPSARSRIGALLALRDVGEYWIGVDRDRRRRAPSRTAQHRSELMTRMLLVMRDRSAIISD